MRSRPPVHSGLPVRSAATQLVLLGGLLWAAEVHGAGVVVALACAVLGWTLLTRALAEHGRRLGPADHVTVTRGTLACVVAALTGESLVAPGGLADPGQLTMLVLTAAVALALDAVDGAVARHTLTATPLGARMDLEVDAFLILVLSVTAAPVIGWWVLAIGVFRYAFLVATWAAPWLAGAVPPRYWRKAVAALQGVVLTVAAAQVLPRGVSLACAALALGLLAWSFGTQVAELWPARRQ
ncbi:phosphatidylglycerophosphate synthase [Phycicoccus badiiscoriae]|uniref:Phosphatidylglycerophosphate synthase n=1 Tax=Pedococcus badiiscoriae TaxID=642776 RepID=A0A852WRH5_9MICO|nr:CDP-alcohol phosphatidyltransferase family protein [Pedococcus badiiscoriae]NYG07896.1 phosphatidylglycerophosphate synthase [Pedococcus badiiscoriae]